MRTVAQWGQESVEKMETRLVEATVAMMATTMAGEWDIWLEKKKAQMKGFQRVVRLVVKLVGQMD